MKQTIILVTVTVACVFLLGSTTRAQLDTTAQRQTELANYDQRLQYLEEQLGTFHRSGQACSPSGCECNCCCPGWFATVDYLNLQVERDDLGFAIRDPAGLGVPAGGQPVLSLDLGSESGYRVGAGRRYEGGWELGLKYTHLRANESQAFAPGASQVLAVLSSPATGLTNADSVTASSDFRYHVIDLEAGHWFDASDTLSVQVLGGVRFASIDHRLRARYEGGAFINGLIDVPTNLDAVGGRLGAALHCNLTQSISLFGSMALSVNSTTINARRREENAGAVVINASRTSHPIAPATEISLGTRYHVGSWSLAAGYEWSNWFNAVNPLEFSDSFNGGTIASSPRDLGLHGLFVNAAFSY